MRFWFGITFWLLAAAVAGSMLCCSRKPDWTERNVSHRLVRLCPHPLSGPVEQATTHVEECTALCKRRADMRWHCTACHTRLHGTRHRAAASKCCDSFSALACRMQDGLPVASIRDLDTVHEGGSTELSAAQNTRNHNNNNNVDHTAASAPGAAARPAARNGLSRKQRSSSDLPKDGLRGSHHSSALHLDVSDGESFGEAHSAGLGKWGRDKGASEELPDRQ